MFCLKNQAISITKQKFAQYEKRIEVKIGKQNNGERFKRVFSEQRRL